MPIGENRGRVFGGAESRITPPVTAADCCAFPAFEQLVKEEGVAGRGCTVRYGRAWAARTVAEVAVSCLGVPAVITAFNRLTRFLGGSGFGTKTGLARVEVDIGAGWVERGSTNWFWGSITVDPPLLSLGSLLRVRTSCGAYSNTWIVA